jgi:two-component system, sensor histidine kinase PdtaS
MIFPWIGFGRHKLADEDGAGQRSSSASQFLSARMSRAVGMFGIRRSRNVIYAFALFAAAALAGWRGYSLYVEHNRILKDARVSAAITAQSAVISFERSLDVADLLGEDIRNYIVSAGGLGNVSLPNLQRYIAARARATSMKDYVLIADASGQPIVLSDRAAPQPVNFSDREWFRAHAVRGEDSYIGTALRSRLGRAIIYTDSKRLSQAGTFAGVVDVAIDAPNVRSVSERKPGDAVVTLWTGDHRTILSNFMDFDMHGDPLTLKPSLPERSVIEGVFEPNLSDAIIVSRRSSARPFFATVTLRASEVLAAWDAEVIGSVALFVVAVLLGGLLAKLAANLAETDLNARWALERSTDALRGALAERDLVVKEIHHRVKNSLQLTSSLMQIQAREFENGAVRAAFRQTQQRLFAIGMIHDVLYQDDSKLSINMRSYLSRLAAEIGRGNEAERRGIKTDLDVEPIELMPEQATPLGLCVAEILMRAYGMAFLPDQSGTIGVKLKEKGNDVELTISNSGQGYVSPQEAEVSLGARLIKTLAAQLHATYTSTEGVGAMFKLSFRPLPISERQLFRH